MSTSRKSIDELYIGEIYIVDNDTEFPIERFLKGKQDIMIKFKKEDYIKDFLVLPNNQLVLVVNGKLALYDENYKLIKIMETIFDGESLNPEGIAFNHETNHLYISDWLHKYLLIFDSSLKKKVRCEEINESPGALCFKKDKLFVCCERRRKIQIYNSKLKFQDSVQIEVMPEIIKASESIICIKSDSVLYFYHFKDFSFYRHFSANYIYGLCEINNKMYLQKYSSCLIFDSNGDLTDEVKLNRDVAEMLIAKVNGGLLVFDSNKHLIKLSQE